MREGIVRLSCCARIGFIGGAGHGIMELKERMFAGVGSASEWRGWLRLSRTLKAFGSNDFGPHGEQNSRNFPRPMWAHVTQTVRPPVPPRIALPPFFGRGGCGQGQQALHCRKIEMQGREAGWRRTVSQAVEKSGRRWISPPAGMEAAPFHAGGIPYPRQACLLCEHSKTQENPLCSNREFHFAKKMSD